MSATASPETSYVGRAAPEFKLASAQGGEVGPQDFRGKSRVVLWFSKGLFCPFCRRNMAQLGLRYPELQALGAEVLQVTHNTLDEARGYLKHYPMKFPYLCDADRAAHECYGVEMIGMNPGGFLASSGAVIADFVLKGETTPLPIPYIRRYVGKDTNQAVFVLDREGIVRSEHRLGPNAPLPSAAELVKELQNLG
ncbi:MAG TPA: peroxiredoxin-like family protein [Burkholderiales bacterium]|nr:peroxiredoxin-like family protein [Burkholderiales bacterium]